MKKDKSLHPISPKIVDNVQQLNSSGLKKTEDKLFFDTVKQLVTQFRRNFDVENKGGDQKKREDQFLDFTYQRISSQLSKIDTENIDYKSIIDRCFKDIDTQTESQQKIVETITQAIEEYFSKKTNKKSEKSSKEDVTKSDAELQNPDVDISIDEDELFKAFDEILEKNKKFDGIQKDYLKQNEQYKERIIQSFKQHLANYSQKLKEKNVVQNTQSNTTIKIQAPKKIEEIKKEEDKKKSPIQSLDKIMKKIDPSRYKKKGRRGFKNAYYRNLIKKYQEEHKDVIPKPFQNVQNIANKVTLGQTQETNVSPKKSLLKPKTDQFGYNIDKETQDQAGELVDRYYKNAKRNFIFLKIKQFFSWSSKMFGKILGPLRILAKPSLKLKNVMIGIGKNLGSAIKILITNSFSNLLKLFVMTPQRMYTLGFIAGFISEWIIQKFGLGKLLGRKENQNDPDSKADKFVKGVKYVFNFIVKPLVNIVKSVFNILIDLIAYIAKFVVKYPKTLVFIGSIIANLDKIAQIRTTVNIAKMAKGGIVNGLLGIGASMATEAIMGGLFKSKSEDKQSLIMKNLGASAKIGKYTSISSVGALSTKDSEKYNDIKEKMDDEYFEIQTIATDLDTLHELKVSVSSGKYEKENVSDSGNYGESFIKRVFTSKLFGFDQKTYNEFKKQENNLSLDGEIAFLTDYLNNRTTKLNTIKVSIEQTSMLGVKNLSNLINNIYKDGKFDNSLNNISVKEGLEDAYLKGFGKHKNNIGKDLGDSSQWNLFDQRQVAHQIQEKYGIKHNFNDYTVAQRVFYKEPGQMGVDNTSASYDNDYRLAKWNNGIFSGKTYGEEYREKLNRMLETDRNIALTMNKEWMEYIRNVNSKEEFENRIEDYVSKYKEMIKDQKLKADKEEHEKKLKEMEEKDKEIQEINSQIDIVKGQIAEKRGAVKK